MTIVVLECLLDNCPKTGSMVDYRRCCGCVHNPLGDKQPEIGRQLCNHHKAVSAPDKERWDIIKQAVGCLHLTLVGPLRGK